MCAMRGFLFEIQEAMGRKRFRNHQADSLTSPVSGETVTGIKFQTSSVWCTPEHADYHKQTIVPECTPSITMGLEIQNQCVDKIQTITETKLYKRRFWMLFLFFACATMNILQFTIYSIISSSVKCFYGVDAYAVNWTSLVYSVAYLVLVIPISWFIDRYSLKVTVLMGCACNCLCAISKAFSLNRSGFPIAMLSQTFSAVGFALLYPIPPKLSALWFGESEICRATAVAVMGVKLGMALGFIVPALLVTCDCSKPELIRQGLAYIAYGLLVINFLIMVLVVTTFQSKPLVPPSETSKAEVLTGYVKSLERLMKNVNFQWLVTTYGLVMGIEYASSALLGQMLAPTYQGVETVIGWIGFSNIVVGVVGILISGHVLDKTHRFKIVSVIYCAGGVFSIAVFTGFLYVSSHIPIFVAVSAIGFFLHGFSPVGYEFAVELTYPEPEGITACILNFSSMAYGLILAFVGSYIQQNFSTVDASLFFFGILVLSTITCGLIKPSLKRREQIEKGKGSKCPETCTQGSRF